MVYNTCISSFFTRDWDYHEKEKVDQKINESRKTVTLIICLEQCSPAWKANVGWGDIGHNLYICMFQFFPKRERFEGVDTRLVIRLSGYLSRLPTKVLRWVMKMRSSLYKPAKHQGIENPSLLGTSIVCISPVVWRIRDLQAVPEPALLYNSSLPLPWLSGLGKRRVLPCLRAPQQPRWTLSRLHRKEHSIHQVLVHYFCASACIFQPP